MHREKLSYRRAVCRALDHVLANDERALFIGEDIAEYGGAFGVSTGLYAKYPGRVIPAPISENGFTGVAVGLAMTGYRPIVEIMFMDFVTLAMDQLINHAANINYMYGGQVNCPMVIRTPAGGYRGYGASHSKSLESLFIGVPGLKVVAPSSVEDAWGLLLSSVYDNNPVLFVEHKLLYNLEGTVDFTAPMEPLGKARVVRPGNDVTLVSHSYGVHICMEAARELSFMGVEAEVIDLRTIKPIDTETVIMSVKKTGKLVCVEEGDRTGGIGAEVASSIAEECLPYIDGRIIRVGKPDVPVPASVKAEWLVLPESGRVIEAVRRALSWN